MKLLRNLALSAALILSTCTGTAPVFAQQTVCPFGPSMEDVQKELQDIPGSKTTILEGVNAKAFLKLFSEAVDSPSSAEGDVVYIISIPDKDEIRVVVVFTNGCVLGMGGIPTSIINKLIMEAKVVNGPQT